jgi:hypothetical protein
VAYVHEGTRTCDGNFKKVRVRHERFQFFDIRLLLFISTHANGMIRMWKWSRDVVRVKTPVETGKLNFNVGPTRVPPRPGPSRSGVCPGNLEYTLPTFFESKCAPEPPGPRELRSIPRQVLLSESLLTHHENYVASATPMSPHSYSNPTRMVRMVEPVDPIATIQECAGVHVTNLAYFVLVVVWLIAPPAPVRCCTHQTICLPTKNEIVPHTHVRALSFSHSHSLLCALPPQSFLLQPFCR